MLLVCYVLFAAASKPEAGIARYATGAMEKLYVQADAPDLPMDQLQDGAGAPTSLAAYRGKVVVLNLWASWCAPCQTEMPTLAALQARFAGQDLVVVPLSIDETAKAGEARAMLAQLTGGVLPFLIDPARRVAFAVRAPGLPTTVLYDRSGREIARLAGDADWNSPEAAALMEAALADEF